MPIDGISWAWRIYSSPGSYNTQGFPNIKGDLWELSSPARWKDCEAQTSLWVLREPIEKNKKAKPSLLLSNIPVALCLPTLFKQDAACCLCPSCLVGHQCNFWGLLCILRNLCQETQTQTDQAETCSDGHYMIAVGAGRGLLGEGEGSLPQRQLLSSGIDAVGKMYTYCPCNCQSVF